MKVRHWLYFKIPSFTQETKKVDFYLDADSARKVFIAVKKACGPIEGVSSVVDGWTLLRGLVGSTKEDTLLGRGHLRTIIRKVLIFSMKLL